MFGRATVADVVEDGSPGSVLTGSGLVVVVPATEVVVVVPLVVVVVVVRALLELTEDVEVDVEVDVAADELEHEATTMRPTMAGVTLR